MRRSRSSVLAARGRARLFARAVHALALAACLLGAGPLRAGGAPLIEHRVAVEYPHDPSAFTQGLVFAGGALYESTGLRGRSSLRKVDPVTGRVVRKRRLSDRVFAEGLALVGDELYQLTWTSGRAFVLRIEDFSLVCASIATRARDGASPGTARGW